MNVYLEERQPSGSDPQLALYIDGDFQFDTTDERIYHESLVLPALSLLHATNPENIRVLICGGGDGLALRECLRFPGVAHADLVDYSAEMIALATGPLAGLNAHSLTDPRVEVHIADAWDFLKAAGEYDLIVCDFTVPRRHEDTRVFSTEWFGTLRSHLSPGGLLAANAVSPQTTPDAFWCLVNTLQAAGLKTLPYRVCIPSFRSHGYGAWAFLLASANRRCTVGDLKRLQCPVQTMQADIAQLWRGTRFSRAERAIARMAPINTLAGGELLPLLLNPGILSLSQPELSELADPFDLNPLFSAIPITHPYHTRSMIETLAEQVAGSVRDLDIPRLIDAVIKRAAKLPERIIAELRRLREFMRESALRFELFSAWSYRLFAALVILMTIANAISPDNAFAKGSFGGEGHGGFSVGHSFSGGRSGSFGSSSFGSESGFSGSRIAGRSSSSSFGGERGATVSPSRSFSSFSSSRTNVLSSPVSPRITGTGFSSSYGRGRAVDIYGYSSNTHVYNYCGSGYGHVHSYTQVYGGHRPDTPPEQHEAIFIASDDLSVLDNGDVVVNISTTSYLLLTNGTAAFMSSTSPDPLMMIYPDPELFANVRDMLNQQQSAAAAAASVRRDWLAWTSWTSAFMPAIKSDQKELANLTDLIHRLDLALQRLGSPPAGGTPSRANKGELELFIGCILRTDSSIAIREPDGKWLTTDLITLNHTDDRGKVSTSPCPPSLAAAVKDALQAAAKAAAAGIAADMHDMDQLRYDYNSLTADLSEYRNIQMVQGDSSYEVDYGTDEIPVYDAINRTQRDLQQTETEYNATQKDLNQLQAQLETLNNAIARYR
jgi:spermidine synthase